MKNAAGKWIGYGLGDTDPDVPRTDPNWHAVTLIREKLVGKYQWARELGVTKGDTIDDATSAAIAEFQHRTNIPAVTEGGHPVADFRTRVRLGAYPPPPPPRHACLTFSGTWAAPGTGYCSWVAQACNVEEIPVQSPWSFGFVGGAPNAPSYRDSVNIAVEWAVDWILEHPTRTFLLGGYSQGGEAASRVRQELEPGGRLAHLKPNLVAGYTFGNPCRQKGHTFYKGSDPGGHGISTFNLTGMGNEWADMARPGDLYTTCPDGAAGRVETDVYELAIDLQLNDPMSFITAFLQHAVKTLQDSGILSSLGGGIGGLFAMAPVVLIGLLGGLLGGGNATVSNDPSLQATIQAAINGLKFLLAGTGPHITYEQPIPDMPWISYVDLARQHVNDWAARTPVRV